MEKQNNFIGGRLTRLPPGFRFQPTDEEIVFQYLKCKIMSLPLPASIIPELPLSLFDPWDLPGDPEEERYFFTKKEAKYRRGSRTNRTTSSGYWKATGTEKHLSPPPDQSNLGSVTTMKGLKKAFGFYRGKSPNGRRTDWYMHEYSLLLNNALPRSHHHMPSSIHHHHQSYEVSPKIEEWVICCVFLKQKLEKDSDATMVEYTSDNYAIPRTIDGNLANNTCSYYHSSSSSSSNSITKASLNELEFEDTSSP
uniref:NAC domain-containing protein n=1 Tax=Opuntia streptacantha TaxID=393608 RepID=A0A7C9D3T6_OPUST